MGKVLIGKKLCLLFYILNIFLMHMELLNKVQH